MLFFSKVAESVNCIAQSKFPFNLKFWRTEINNKSVIDTCHVQIIDKLYSIER